MDTVALVLQRSRTIVRRSNILNGLRSGGGETIWQSEFTGDCGWNELSLGGVELVDANGREADRRRNTVSEERG